MSASTEQDFLDDFLKHMSMADHTLGQVQFVCLLLGHERACMTVDTFMSVMQDQEVRGRLRYAHLLVVGDKWWLETCEGHWRLNKVPTISTPLLRTADDLLCRLPLPASTAGLDFPSPLELAADKSQPA